MNAAKGLVSRTVASIASATSFLQLRTSRKALPVATAICAVVFLMSTVKGARTDPFNVVASSENAPQFQHVGPYEIRTLHFPFKVPASVGMGEKVELQLSLTAPVKLSDDEKPFPLLMMFNGFQVREE